LIYVTMKLKLCLCLHSAQPNIRLWYKAARFVCPCTSYTFQPLYLQKKVIRHLAECSNCTQELFPTRKIEVKLTLCALWRRRGQWWYGSSYF
jgi:hypothetical protein